MLISTLVPVVDPQVAIRPPDLLERIDSLQVAGSTFSNTTSNE